ncbi:hypothetical protein LZ30DRAFT_309728 [Colletotrichum cereale]|nr:hypothetical protein LZ30DRAFT_309728 [Colletotrichum cereale]
MSRQVSFLLRAGTSTEFTNLCADTPDDAPQLNSKVPPFFDWRAQNGIEPVGEVNDRFRQGLDFVETDLLQLYKYQQSRTGHMVQQVYDAFGSNIYEEAVQGSFGDFSHRRRSQATEFGPAAVSNARRGEQTALVEKLFRVSIPALEAFVPSELRSSLTSKYFGALAKIMADPTSSELLSKSDDDTEPHDSIYTEDESRQKWVVSRGMIKQTDLRFILDTSTDQTRCPECERGVIYSNPANGVLHLRKMHRVGAKTDRVLQDYLVTLPAALRERLDEELCGLLNACHNILASILRKMAAIQSGVMYKDEFRGSERGIPYSLIDAFKLIVLFVCAVPEALHEIRWFYGDFDYSKNTRDLLSPKIEAQKKILERLGEVTGELIRKAERALVSPTNSAQEGDPENFMTSVGLHYLSLQILFNLLRRPVKNRKRASDLYAAYAKNLVSRVTFAQGRAS